MRFNGLRLFPNGPVPLVSAFTARATGRAETRPYPGADDTFAFVTPPASGSAHLNSITRLHGGDEGYYVDLQMSCLTAEKDDASDGWTLTRRLYDIEPCGRQSFSYNRGLIEYCDYVLREVVQYSIPSKRDVVALQHAFACAKDFSQWDSPYVGSPVEIEGVPIAVRPHIFRRGIDLARAADALFPPRSKAKSIVSPAETTAFSNIYNFVVALGRKQGDGSAAFITALETSMREDGELITGQTHHHAVAFYAGHQRDVYQVEMRFMKRDRDSVMCPFTVLLKNVKDGVAVRDYTSRTEEGPISINYAGLPIKVFHMTDQQLKGDWSGYTAADLTDLQERVEYRVDSVPGLADLTRSIMGDPGAALKQFARRLNPLDYGTQLDAFRAHDIPALHPQFA